MALTYYPVIQFFNDDGTVLNGGKINTYITGTSTNKPTYQDQGQATAHANPIVLDADGRPPGGAIWLLTDAEYRLVIKDADDVTLQTIDDVSGIISPLAGSVQFEEIQFDNNKGIYDANGNEQLLFGETASAVNYAKLTNAATTGTVTLEALGDDSNVSLNIKSKGSGTVQVNGVTISGAYTGKTGLVLSNDTDTDHDIAISAGSISDSTNTVRMDLAAHSKRIDGTWVAGDGNGGLPSTVTLAADTTYHVFIIAHTDGTVDAGFDTDTTATNLLAFSGYTYYKRLGSVVTNSSSNIIQFTQIGNKFVLTDPLRDVNDSNPGTSAVTSALTVPTGIKVEADMQISVFDDSATTTARYCLATSLDSSDTVPSSLIFSVVAVGSGDIYAANRFGLTTNTSGQVRYRLSASDVDTNVYIHTYGWWDLTLGN